jgi:hypothetical protein
MKNQLITKCVMTLIVTVVAVAPRCMAASTPRLTVVIYDFAHVGPETLAATEKTVSAIFSHADVRLVWLDGFAYAAARRGALSPPPEDPATLVVKLQPESAAARFGVNSDCGGIGLSSGAIVFVRSFDAGGTTSEATRLGYVIAHELGHMLLGPNAHAIVGIMRGTWLPEDWKHAAQGTLGFTHNQKQQIRTWIDQRRVMSSTVAAFAGERMDVTVCNVDHIPDTAIEHAENQAVYVFRAADVEIHWMSCGVELPTPDARMRPGFIVRVLAGGPFAKADPVSLDPIGRAFMNASGFGFLADAYYGAIRDVKSLYPGVASDQLLGYTIVHELGHLLIGPGHRPNGIMRAAWSREEFEKL